MRIRTAYDLAAVARGRRLDLGWSQSEAAQQAGVSRKWVSDFETGKARVDLAAVLRLLDVLDISLDTTDSQPSNGVNLDDLLRDYKER